MKLKTFVKSASTEGKNVFHVPGFLVSPKLLKLFYSRVILETFWCYIPFISIWLSAESICNGKKKHSLKSFATVVSREKATERTAKRKSIIEKKMLITREFFFFSSWSDKLL